MNPSGLFDSEEDYRKALEDDERILVNEIHKICLEFQNFYLKNEVDEDGSLLVADDALKIGDIENTLDNRIYKTQSVSQDISDIFQMCSIYEDLYHGNEEVKKSRLFEGAYNKIHPGVSNFFNYSESFEKLANKIENFEQFDEEINDLKEKISKLEEKLEIE